MSASLYLTVDFIFLSSWDSHNSILFAWYSDQMIVFSCTFVIFHISYEWNKLKKKIIQVSFVLRFVLTFFSHKFTLSCTFYWWMKHKRPKNTYCLQNKTSYSRSQRVYYILRVVTVILFFSCFSICCVPSGGWWSWLYVNVSLFYRLLIVHLLFLPYTQAGKLGYGCFSCVCFFLLYLLSGCLAYAKFLKILSVSYDPEMTTLPF